MRNILNYVSDQLEHINSLIRIQYYFSSHSGITQRYQASVLSLDSPIHFLCTTVGVMVLLYNVVLFYLKFARVEIFKV